MCWAFIIELRRTVLYELSLAISLGWAAGLFAATMIFSDLGNFSLICIILLVILGSALIISEMRRRSYEIQGLSLLMEEDES